MLMALLLTLWTMLTTLLSGLATVITTGLRLVPWSSPFVLWLLTCCGSVVIGCNIGNGNLLSKPAVANVTIPVVKPDRRPLFPIIHRESGAWVVDEAKAGSCVKSDGCECDPCLCWPCDCKLVTLAPPVEAIGDEPTPLTPEQFDEMQRELRRDIIDRDFRAYMAKEYPKLPQPPKGQRWEPDYTIWLGDHWRDYPGFWDAAQYLAKPDPVSTEVAAADPVIDKIMQAAKQPVKSEPKACVGGNCKPQPQKRAYVPQWRGFFGRFR